VSPECLRHHPSQSDAKKDFGCQCAKIKVLNRPSESVPMKLQPAERQILIVPGRNVAVKKKIDHDENETGHRDEG
jgi:hypothetical protein